MSIFNGIITKGLVSYFDTNNPQSFLNNGENYFFKSLVKWDKSTTSDITLNDYGLTAYDIGRANHLTSTTLLSLNDSKLKIFPINSNNSTGTTQSYKYPFSTSFTSTGKVYLQLSGGGFQNYFKLEDYDWELLPYRYNNGISFESWIKIDSSTSGSTKGIFLYIGTRSENKFSTLYSGDSGYTTSNGLNLGSDHINDLEEGVYDNNIAFIINNDLKLGYKYINHTGITIENYSENSLTVGWKHIAITFKPCDIFPDEFNGGVCGDSASDSRFKINWDEIKDCLDKREGKLTFYVNGKEFWKIDCFPEQFWFKGLDTEREKQISVPFNLIWGGGSFGLKNSYHYPKLINQVSGITYLSSFTEFSANTSGFTEYSSLTYSDYSGLTYFEIDHSKDNLLIEKNFNGSFNGGISKLRIYQTSLSSEDIKLNYNQEATDFGLRQFKGGRVIYST